MDYWSKIHDEPNKQIDINKRIQLTYPGAPKLKYEDNPNNASQKSNDNKRKREFVSDIGFTMEDISNIDPTSLKSFHLQLKGKE